MKKIKLENDFPDWSEYNRSPERIHTAYLNGKSLLKTLKSIGKETEPLESTIKEYEIRNNIK